MRTCSPVGGRGTDEPVALVTSPSWRTGPPPALPRSPPTRSARTAPDPADPWTFAVARSTMARAATSRDARPQRRGTATSRGVRREAGKDAMGAAASGGIFLSYRRQETEHVAGRLADRLGERFGTSRVFMDIDSIPPGADFVEAINSAVSRCDVLLAMIGPGWTDLEDDEGHRRLDDPGDFVVLEVRAALERGIPVIPVLVDGARMPRQNQLPKPLEPLATRNAVHVDAETFRSDVSVLIDALATTVPPAVAAGRTETDAPTTDRVAETAPDRARLPRRTVLRYAVGAGAVIAAGA